MPKAKPTSVVVHRIELQKTERELLEGYVAANGIGSILSGVGNLLNPFSTLITGLIAAWIAKEGIEDLWEWINDKLKEKDKRLSADYLAYLDARNGAIAAGADPGVGPMTEQEYKKEFDHEYMTNWDKISAWFSPTSMEGRSDSAQRMNRAHGTGREDGSIGVRTLKKRDD
jgi:lysozyme family protein